MSDMYSPKISLLVAAYNIEAYIEQCLESLTHQTLKDIEIIVVNDGSTDNTLEKIQKLQQQDNRIKIINQKNQGLSNVRRIGFEAATGKYIYFIDGDDWLDVEACEKLYKHAEKEQADVVVFHYQKAYPQKNNTTHFNYVKTLGYRKEKLSSYHPFISYVNDGLYCSLPFKLIRKQFLIEKELKFPENINHGEDNLFSAILFLNHPKIDFLNNFLYYYRQRIDSLGCNFEGYINDCKPSLSYMKKELHKINPLQVIKEYAKLYFFNYMTTIYILSLKTGKKSLIKKMKQQILQEKITLNLNKVVGGKSIKDRLTYYLYSFFPRLFLWVKKIMFHLKNR